MAVTTFAAIDISSYEITMKIFEFSKKGGFRTVDDIRYRLNLGVGVYSGGTMEVDKVDTICEVLNDFKRIMAEYGVKDYRACTTSVFREMKNPLIIIEQIFRRTGIHVEVLSNAEQHFLGYKSIAAIENGFKKMIQKGTAILDVGGGNLQISLFDKDALVTTQGLKMGSLRIRQRLQELEKTTIHYDKLVEEFIRNDLMSFQRLYLKDKDIRNVILMGDFITDMIFQEEMEDKIITREEFMKRYEDTVGKSVDLLAQEMEIDPEYASLVVPTMVVCRNFIDIFNAESLWAPGVSLLDGIAYDFAEKKKFIKSVHNFENDILVTSKNIAKRYSSSKSHIQGTMNLCLNIFDSMKKVHGMGSRERLLLQIAALLHDCGKYISMENVSECSYQIIMSTDIIGLSSLERQMIACAVRFNNSAFVHYDELYSMGIAIDRESYIKVAKMTAILRLANAMDRSHYQKVKGIKTALKDRELQMIVDSAQDISLELGLLKDKVAFFEEVFGIRLVLRRKGRA